MTYVLISIVALSQLVGIVFVFISIPYAIIAFSIYAVSLTLLLLSFILERRREKKEEIDYDDCNY